MGEKERIKRRVEQWKTEGSKVKKEEHLRGHKAEFWIEQENKTCCPWK